MDRNFVDDEDIDVNIPFVIANKPPTSVVRLLFKELVKDDNEDEDF